MARAATPASLAAQPSRNELHLRPLPVTPLEKAPPAKIPISTPDVKNDGNGPHYDRARYHVPVSTRFISQDHLGQETKKNGPNLDANTGAGSSRSPLVR